MVRDESRRRPDAPTWSHERAQNHLDFLMRLWWSGRGDDIINPDVSLGALGLKNVPDVGQHRARASAQVHLGKRLG